MNKDEKILKSNVMRNQLNCMQTLGFGGFLACRHAENVLECVVTDREFNQAYEDLDEIFKTVISMLDPRGGYTLTIGTTYNEDEINMLGVIRKGGDDDGKKNS